MTKKKLQTSFRIVAFGNKYTTVWENLHKKGCCVVSLIPRNFPSPKDLFNGSIFFPYWKTKCMKREKLFFHRPTRFVASRAQKKDTSKKNRAKLSKLFSQTNSAFPFSKRAKSHEQIWLKTQFNFSEKK